VGVGAAVGVSTGVGIGVKSGSVLQSHRSSMHITAQACCLWQI